MMLTFDMELAHDEGYTPAQSADPVIVLSVATTSTAADRSTIGSPSNTAGADADASGELSEIDADESGLADRVVITPSTTLATAGPAVTPGPSGSNTDSDGDYPGCGPGVSPDGNSNAGDCPPARRMKMKAKKARRDVDESSSTGGGQWKVKTVYSEFNTAAWIRDLGGDCDMPAPRS